ncbi:MAG: transketolase family protein [Acetivibrionales bacterium]|jgi:transketolase
MIANRVAYGNTINELAATNNKIAVVDSDCIGVLNYGNFAKNFPERFYECGIAEQNMVSIAAGLASCGMIPFVASFAVFTSMRALDQVRNMVCYNNYSVKVIGTHAGIETGFDGATHQAIEDIAIMRAIPNITVLAPSSPIMTAKLTKIMAETDGPFYMRFGREPNQELYDENAQFAIGGSHMLRDGKQLTIIACGRMVDLAVQAADELAKDQIQVRVIDMYSIKPIDEKAIMAAAKDTGLILTIEDHNVIGGLGGAVSEYTAGNCPCKVVKMGMQDEFGRSGTMNDLYNKYGLTKDGIVKKVKELVNR